MLIALMDFDLVLPFALSLLLSKVIKNHLPKYPTKKEISTCYVIPFFSCLFDFDLDFEFALSFPINQNPPARVSHQKKMLTCYATPSLLCLLYFDFYFVL
jgi:hypothetical protein